MNQINSSIYHKLLIYFTSGTGNSYRVSEWVITCSKVENQIIPIELADSFQPANTVFDHKTLLTIIMPTHAFTAPWNMFKFISNLPKLPKTKRIHATVIATRAGWKLGPFFMPGLSGSGTFLISLILWLKGFKVKGVLSVDMPSNWLAFHWGLHPRNVRTIVKKAKPKTTQFISKILEGKTSWFSINNLYEFIFGILLFPITIAYLLVGRFYFAKVFFANLTCNACGICEKICPNKALIMKKGVPFWTYKCESCMRCMAYCPKAAIEASHPWAIILFLLTGIPVFSYILNYFGQHIPILENFLNFIYIYPAIFLSYYVFYFLVRIPIFNNIFTFTTLTHFFRRYHAPGVKTCNFKKNSQVKKEVGLFI